VPALLLLELCVNVRAQGAAPGTLILRLTHHASINDIAQDYGLSVVDAVVDRQVYEVSVSDPDTAGQTAFYLNWDYRVRYCEFEADTAITEVQADPFHISFDKTSSTAAFVSQTAYSLIDLGVVNTVTSSVAPVIVAVLDTGVDLTHPSLAGQLVAGYNALSPESDPLDIPDGVNNTVVGHGTMIAGVIIHDSPNSVVLPVRVMNADGIGTLMNVIKGLHYAVLNGANVINMSFETSTNSVAFLDALDEATRFGAVLIASAGNEGTSVPSYPAAYPGVIGVGSVENDNTLSSFSNYGINAQVVAPGDDISSTFWDGTFASWAGTSFAAPFVTAEAAEIIARHQYWSPDHVIRRILQTANSVDSVNPTFAGLLGAGIVDVQAAITTPGN
jgi:subtilisin family serine protease